MQIDFTQARSCQKCGAKFIQLERHHRGCEKMWLRHFKHRARTKLFQAFEARYWKFLKEDTVDLCIDCHKTIHRVYIKIISRRALKHGKCSTWTWDQANDLMSALKHRCDLWLVNKTIQRARK